MLPSYVLQKIFYEDCEAFFACQNTVTLNLIDKPVVEVDDDILGELRGCSAIMV